MKKILLIICFMFVFSVTGCSNSPATTKDVRYATVRTETLSFIEQFGTVQYSNLVWDTNFTLTTYGQANHVLAIRDNYIHLRYAEGNKYILFQFELDTGTSLTVKLWNVMITYVDQDREIFVHLDYYFYNKPFVQNYSAITVNKRFGNWAEELSILSLDDLEWIIEQLGYKIIE